jgi:hypothetical protein
MNPLVECFAELVCELFGVRQLAAALAQASLLAGIRKPNDAARASSRPGKAAASCRTPKQGQSPALPRAISNGARSINQAPIPVNMLGRFDIGCPSGTGRLLKKE